MPPSVSLPPIGRIYVSTVILAGLYVLGTSIHQLLLTPVDSQWFLLVALTLLSGSASVRLPAIPASISISETFVFAAVLLYGPAAGTLTVALDGLMASFWMAKRRREPYRALFNMSAPAISAWTSARIFFWTAGISPLALAPASLNVILPSLALFALVYFAVNSWLIAAAISIETSITPLRVWRDHFVWLSLNYFFGASVAILLVTYTRQVDVTFLGIILPLLLVLYFTFKISMDRVSDARRHVDKVNSMYLSTVETLAMAIDAKDQVTHGHIRRVQRYAVGLAREVGVEDKSLLQAIETAALLHDMGKLAVPEHILNKPGRLTRAEFDKMKLHASVGADILSAIDFPYPVVPIVRHHHESWDGSGYPDGLRGVEIPIGARILSVVDCFDALTSDRPYRPRLTDQEALVILNDRKGTMYDPLIVETFERLYSSLDTTVDHTSVLNLPKPTDISVLGRPNPSTPINTHAVITSVVPSLSSQRLIHTVLQSASRLNPSSVCVFYEFDQARDEIVAFETNCPAILGLRIPLGQRLSGWVAANRKTIVNSDAALDLGITAACQSPKLLSCLSVPVFTGRDLIGVISIYTPQSAVYRPDELVKEIEVIARELLIQRELQKTTSN